MTDEDLYETHRDLLHEWPAAEEPLRAWRERRALEAARRRAQANRLDILVKCYGGLPEPSDDNAGESR